MEDVQHVRAAPKGFTIETGRYKNLEILSWDADGTKVIFNNNARASRI